MNKRILNIRASAPPLALATISAVLGSLSLGASHPGWAATLSTLFWTITFVLIADALARTREYYTLRYKIQSGRWALVSIQIRRMRHSWCQRHAASTALRDEALPAPPYKLLGYRWWNIFPDGTFSKSSPWLSRRWWLALVTFWDNEGHGGRTL